MWGSSQAAFMACCKLILGLSVLTGPFFGALNDRTRSSFGRRRVWFVGGAFAIVVGVALTALASLFKAPAVFFLGVLVWTVGESASDSTSEAIVPDLVPRDDYDRVGAIRSMFYLLGGIVAYASIIVCSYYLRLPFYWLYGAFLGTLVFTVPVVIKYAAPTEAERLALEGEAPEQETRLGSILWDAYIKPVAGADCKEFRTVLLSSTLFCAGASSILFILLVTRDVTRPGDERAIQLHFALACLSFFICAALGSVVSAYVAEPAQRRTLLVGISVLYGVTELFMPMVAFAPYPQLSLYVVACVKGVLFGSIMALFSPLVWDTLPLKFRTPDETGHDHVADTMALASLFRQLGAGLGNAFFGFILQYSLASDVAEPVADGEVVHYPLQGYFALFAASAVTVWIGAWILYDKEVTKLDVFDLAP